MILFGLVISLELVNTAIENVVVLVSAIFSAIIGLIIFIPKIF